ncbi:methyl-accepting chemotaxis protein [Agrobacterium sp. fls2-241-TYG-188a]|uniref:methyl-accepting chemotaxis protein n=1 Tax=Agrobacterium sp. fls2-241-TYG-188a TaxID=3040275 RepID=UPI00254FEFF7|nr:methyl-accepting chemotaxis protein [Agrobacterium sp. fls2-241-TYG-188a]
MHISVRKFSFRTQLTMLALVPLLATMVLGGILSQSAYTNFLGLEKAVHLVRLARAGAALQRSMPNEASALPADRAAARKETDDDYAKLIDAYDTAFSDGNEDAGLAALKAKMVQNFANISEYRRKVDSGDKDTLLPLKHLQPISAVGLDITSRAGSLVEDSELSRAIRGYYSFLQANNGYLIYVTLGRKYAQNGSLQYDDLKHLFAAKGLITNALKPMQEFLPQKIMDEQERFWQSADGKFIANIVDKMTNNVSSAPSTADLSTWNAAMNLRRDAFATMSRAIVDDIGDLAQTKIDVASRHLTFMLASLGLLIVLTVALSLSVFKALSSAIRGISGRMGALADGDQESAIPSLGRKDEIGEMAHAVEIFRQAAIRNAELEADATSSRLRAEAERAEMQALAEAEAESRLEQATRTFAASLKRLAQGDMQCEIDTPMAPQFEGLRADFNTSLRQLRDALLSVGNSVETVTGGAREISDASDDLAKRTEQQAASLEETAAALEQITSNVVSTSKRTSEARDIVRDARSHAGQSGAVVRNAVAAMERIEEASRQINQIISVIDEIAFQTNLLALNAGVEAARAGEAGKGFAVVAQEVRELAQRSARAAKEIKGLINNSTLAVAEGVKLVSDTGEGLNTIEELVQVINTHMDAIATAAEEQSSGLAQVNTAVNHMDQATQKNAAMVEEMNAAGAGLALESRKLSNLLSQFQLGASSHQLRMAASQMKTGMGSSEGGYSSSTGYREKAA